MQNIGPITATILVCFIPFDFVLGEIIQGSSILSPEKDMTTTLNGNQTIITNDTVHLQNVTYIKASFRITSVYKLPSYDGIFWSNGNNIYYVLVHPYSSILEIYAPQEQGLLRAKIEPAFLKDSLSTIKILFGKGSFSVRLNNASAIYFSQTAANSNPVISRIGITSFNSVVEFEPLKIVGTELPHLCSFPNIDCLLRSLSH